MPGVSALVNSVMLFIFIGSCSGLARGQEPYLIFRHALTLTIYAITVATTVRVIMMVDQVGLRRLRANFAKMALGYAVATLVIVQFFGAGIDLNSARFEIIGPSVIAMMSYAPTFIVFDVLLWEAVGIAVSYVLIFYSITRTFPLLIAAQLASMFPAILRFFSARIVVTGVVAVGIGLAFASTNSGSIQRWQQRLFESRDATGEDYTAYTRITETQFMIDSFLSGPGTVLFGNGMAHETTWLNSNEVGGGSEHGVGFGHNQHMSLLFIAGVVGGLPLLAVQLQQFVASLRTTVALSRRRWGKSDHTEFVTLWGALIVIAYFISDFSAFAFGFRGSTLWYGIGTGALLAGRAILRFRAEAEAEAEAA